MATVLEPYRTPSIWRGAFEPFAVKQDPEMSDALAAALRQIMEENDLTRIDIGAYPERVIATAWADAPPFIGCICAMESAPGCDEAIEKAVAEIHRKRGAAIARAA